MDTWFVFAVTLGAGDVSDADDWIGTFPTEDVALRFALNTSLERPGSFGAVFSNDGKGARVLVALYKDGKRVPRPRAN